MVVMKTYRKILGIALLFLPFPTLAGQAAPIPDVVRVPAGQAVIGSDRAERELAYRLDEAAYGHSVTRQRRWYESEPARQTISHGAFDIMRNLVSQADYRKFIEATGHHAPDVSPSVWAGYGLIHPFKRTGPYRWHNDQPVAGRENHPVVLVAHRDAQAYAAWLSRVTGQRWRLPTEREWEIAARGRDGRAFPWGDEFAPDRLNSHDQGPFATVPVGSFRSGASPFGMLDAAGQVFEWTATQAGKNRFIVKGGSWDDSGCGICRPAARHSRPSELKHILIGFRLVRQLESK